MLLPLNLQFFADGSDEGNNGGNDSSTPAGDNGDKKGNEDQTKSGEKTFTQEQVTAMMAKEKNEGKRSILKSLGLISILTSSTSGITKTVAVDV